MKKTAPRQTLQAPRAAEADGPLSPARAFVVQFREETGSAGKDFTGRVEHMITGHAARFTSAAELLAFFGAALGTGQTQTAKKGKPER